MMVRNTFLSGIDTAVVIGLGLVATPLIISAYGIEYYGLYVLLAMLSLTGVLGIFDLGIEGTLLKFVSRAEAAADRRRALEFFAYGLAAFSTIGAFLCGAILILSTEITLYFTTELLDIKAIHIAVQYVIINLFIQFVSSGFSATLMGLGRYDVAKLSNVISNCIYFISILVITEISRPFPMLFLALIFSSSLRFLVLIAALWREFRITQMPHLSLNQGRYFLESSLKLFFNKLIGVLYNFFPRVFLSLIGTLMHLGIYDALSKFPNFLRVLLSVLNAAVIPAFAPLIGKRNLRRTRMLILKLLQLSILAFVPISIWLFFNIKYLLSAWVGSAFSDLSSIAQILILGLSFRVIPALNSTISVSLDFIEESSKLGLLSLAIMIILALILYPSLGIFGIAVANLISEFVLFLTHCSLISKRFEITIFDCKRLDRGPAKVIIPSMAAQYLLSFLLDDGIIRLGISTVILGGTFVVGFSALSITIKTKIRRYVSRWNRRVFE